MSDEARYTWLETREALVDWLDRPEGEALAVDTESDHGQGSQVQVCLIQLATPDEVVMLDPFEWEHGALQPLWDVLGDDSRLKIFHAGYNDLEELDRDWGIDIRNVFDTRTAARFLGTQRSGLDWLLEAWLGIDVPDDVGWFDWGQRPLPERALRYAASDVRHLHDLRDRLAAELHETDWWEPFQQQSEHLAREAVHDPDDFDPEGWRRIDRGPNLNREGKRALRALYRWRQTLCEAQNRPPEHIVNDDGLVHLASHRPTTREELEAVSPVPDDVFEAYGDAILEVIERAEQRNIPKTREHETSWRLSADEEARYDVLREWRNARAELLGLPDAFVATNDTLESIARHPPREVSELEEFADVLPWQRERLGEELVGVLQTVSTSDEANS